MYKKIKKIEIDFCQEAGDKAKKRKDYINALQYFQQTIALLSDASIFKGDESESRIKKLKKKEVIRSLQDTF